MKEIQKFDFIHLLRKLILHICVRQKYVNLLSVHLEEKLVSETFEEEFVIITRLERLTK